MRNYKIQPGVVLESVCGEYLLVATREARKSCPYVKQINATAAYYWGLLEQGLDTEEIIEIASEKYGVEREKIRSGLQRFMDALRHFGYLHPEGK